jgi:hypothetical protein
MSATVLNIVEKTKAWDVVPAHLDNFVLSEGDTVLATVLRDSPHISLYSLDDTTRRAIFVETPPEINLTEAAFYYDAQYKHALRLFALPYDELHALAADLPEGDTIFLHSIGRCGSTVISKALNTVNGVVSLSEPDVYTQLHLVRFLDRSRDDEITRLLQSCTRLLGSRTPTLVIKFRGMCIHIGDLIHRAYPRAKNLFLYRHTESWARSMGLATLPVDERRTPSTDVPLHRRSIAPLSYQFAERHGRESTRVELAALMWLSMMESYVRLYTQGIPFLAARYEEIQSQPVRVLEAIFAYCGLPVDAVEQAYTVFSKDSQEGTIFAREAFRARAVAPLDEDDYAQMRAILSEHRIINTPDYIAPGTLRLEPD